MMYKISKAPKNYENFPFYRKSKINYTMKADVIEEESQIRVMIDMPGFELNDIKIKTDEPYVEVYAHKSKEEANFIFEERYAGDFYRRFYLGEVNRLKASYKSGVLEITAQKKI